MNGEALKKDGADMCEYIANFWKNIRDCTPLHQVKPGEY